MTDALLAELSRIDQRLRQEVERLRADAPAADDDQFRGLYISDAEVDAILDGQWALTPAGLDGLLPDALPIATTVAPVRRDCC